VRSFLKFSSRGEVVSFSTSPKSCHHPLSAVRDRLFCVFDGTTHTWRPSPPSVTWGRATSLCQGPSETLETTYQSARRRSQFVVTTPISTEVESHTLNSNAVNWPGYVALR
jgi:hypothetical protein